MNWIRNIVFYLGLFALLGACEKRFNNPIAEKYEIKGTLFEGYDAPAIPDYPLELIYYEVNSRSQWVNQKTIDRTRTDKDGYFEFKYSKFSDSKKGHLAIIQDESGLKEGQAFVSAPFLQGILINQNLERNISGLSQSKLVINFKWNNQLDSDTLFVNASGMMLAEGADFKEERQSAWGYILNGDKKELLLESFLQWNGNISVTSKAFLYWGTGYDSFYSTRLSMSTETSIQGKDIIEFIKTGFPYTDTVYVNLD